MLNWIIRWLGDVPDKRLRRNMKKTNNWIWSVGQFLNKNLKTKGDHKMKICLNCGLELSNSSLQKQGSPCPTKGCYGTISDIDENVYETILTLNGKGYKTLESCSGHTYGNNKSAYLILHPLVNPKLFQTLPRNFVQDVNNPRKISREISAPDVLHRLKEIGEAAYDLLEWAESLPDPMDIIAKFEHSAKDDYTFINKIISKFNLEYTSYYPFNGNYVYVFRTIIPSSIVEQCNDEILVLAKQQGLIGNSIVGEFEP
jgi:hypothetical protein